jgi:hypothetical protein
MSNFLLSSIEGEQVVNIDQNDEIVITRESEELARYDALQAWLDATLAPK